MKSTTELPSIIDYADPIAPADLASFLREKIAMEQLKLSEIDLARLVAKYLASDGNHTVFTQDSIWSYESETGCYRILEDTIIANALYATHDSKTHDNRFKLRESTVNQCIKGVKNRLSNSSYFSNVSVGIAVKDRFLTVMADSHTGQHTVVDKLHSSEHRQRAHVPVVYNPDADTSKIDSFMSQILPQEEVRNFIYEVIGVALLGLGRRHRIIMVLAGEGDNGKGVLVELIEKLIPHELRSAVSPSEFSTEYLRYPLVGSRFNACGEIPEIIRQSIPWIKKLTGGDTMTARRNGGGNSFSFIPEAVQCWSTNELPLLPATGYSIKKRFALVPFSVQIPKESQNPYLAQELFETGAEGFLRRVIEGARRVVERQRFLIPELVQIATENWLDRSQSVVSFERVVIERTQCADNTVTSEAMYEAYNTFCVLHLLTPVSQNQLTRSLKTMGIEHTKSNKAIFRGVRIREDRKEKHDTISQT